MFDKIEESKSKKVSIKINSKGEVILKKPKNFDDKLLEQFINLKKEWILQNKCKILEKLSKFKNVLDYKSILMNGNEIQVFYNSKNNITEHGIYTKNLKTLITYIKKYASQIINDRVDYLSKKYNLNVKSISIENTRKRWGACTLNKDIKINFRAVFLPQESLDYIITHELMHILEFNHSKRFWQLVNAKIPNYINIKKDLKDKGFLLELYR